MAEQAKTTTATKTPAAIYTTAFHLTDRVLIDGDPSIQATVISVKWSTALPELEVSWVHSGDVKYAWIAEFRLSKVEA